MCRERVGINIMSKRLRRERRRLRQRVDKLERNGLCLNCALPRLYEVPENAGQALATFLCPACGRAVSIPTQTIENDAVARRRIFRCVVEGEPVCVEIWALCESVEPSPPLSHDCGKVHIVLQEVNQFSS